MSERWVSDLVIWMLPTAILVMVWLLALRRMGGPGSGLLSVSRSKAKVYMETDIEMTFKDVAGVDEAKNELQEIASFLRSPPSYGRLGARMPKGVLLVGPPGTGKTLLARGIATAVDLLTAHRHALDRGAARLLAQETLVTEDLKLLAEALRSNTSKKDVHRKKDFA